MINPNLNDNVLIEHKERERERRNNRISHFDELINLSPFEDKVNYAKAKIKDFFLSLDSLENINDGYEIIVAFSGGKDSTVLLDLVCKTYDELIKNKIIQKQFFIVPGYAYEITFPETIKFVHDCAKYYRDTYSFVKEVLFVKPKLSWYEILTTKGYPIFSKQQSVLLNRIKKCKTKNGLTSWIFKMNTSRYGMSYNRLFLLDDKMQDWSFALNKLSDKQKEYFNYDKFLNKNCKIFYSEKCCDNIKGGLKHIKNACFIGVMASESDLRKNSWIKYGCNIINNKKMVSRPLSIWKSVDVWKYILKNDLDINIKYGLISASDKSDLNKVINQFPRVNTNDINQQLNYKLNQILKYKRLGCISCPYGCHIEQQKNKDNNKKHRFSVLYNESINLYKAHVINTGMFKVLIDMGIEIPEDKDYEWLRQIRQAQIDNWYENIIDNLASIITQIENYQDYKNYSLKNCKYHEWIYSDDELKTIFNNYKLNEKYKVKDFINKVYKYRKNLKIHTKEKI